MTLLNPEGVNFSLCFSSCFKYGSFADSLVGSGGP